MSIVHFLEGSDDITRGHPLGVQVENFVAHRGEAGLVFLDNCGSYFAEILHVGSSQGVRLVRH